MGIEGDSILSRISDADRQPISHWWLAIHDVSGKPDAEIGWYPAAESPVCLDGLVFPRGQPELHLRQISAHPHDIPQMLDPLQVSGIMPAEVPVS